MRKLTRFLTKFVAFSLALLLPLLSIETAWAEQPPDQSAPWLSKLSVSASSITNLQSKTLIYRGTLSDDRQVQSATCQLRKGALASSLASFRRVSGSHVNGTWECKVPFAKRSSVGDWKLEVVVVDATGNRSDFKALTSKTFEHSTSLSASTPAIRSISSGVFKVIDSSEKLPEQSISQPFTLVGEFGLSGYAEIWPQTLPKLIAKQAKCASAKMARC